MTLFVLKFLYSRNLYVQQYVVSARGEVGFHSNSFITGRGPMNCRYQGNAATAMGGATAGDGGTGPPLSKVNEVQSPAIDEALFNRY